MIIFKCHQVIIADVGAVAFWQVGRCVTEHVQTGAARQVEGGTAACSALRFEARKNRQKY